ncbi:MAG: intracellular sulfur oxidation DsrE/DsrF family protein [Oleispira sp.]|jgi:intracellular sulfur oxidation DsrE/DsrF family protein
MLGKKGFISVCALTLLLVNTVLAQDTATKPNAQLEAPLAVTGVTLSKEVIKPSKLQANIALHTLEELKKLLVQAEMIANDEAGSEYDTDKPISVVLHGEEIHAFVRSNYRNNKALVDLAARLDAFNVIEVKVCKRWMGANGIMESQLPPFIEPVPFGLGERERLQKAGYAYF